MQIQVIRSGKTYYCSGKEGETVFSVLQKHKNTAVEAPCGGRGRCGKCTVEIDGEKKLACATQIADGMKVLVPRESAAVVAEQGNAGYFTADTGLGYTAACDIGTTTIVCHLLSPEGKKLATASAYNRQRESGADVVSRIQAPLLLMHDQITTEITQMLSKLMKEACVGGTIERLAVSGNTVMCHLLAGISAKPLGIAPFTPQEYFGREFEGSSIGLPLCEQVYILPAVSGYVGGDIAADLLVVMPEHEDEETLLLDIGTNGEIVLGKADSFHCCAAAAGPAFEGAEITMGMSAQKGAISHVYLDKRRLRCDILGDTEAIGICGSGLLDALSVFLEMGIVDGSGMIAEADTVSVAYRKYIGEYSGQACIRLTPEVCVTQEDIHKLLLAKAAIAAGVKVLMKERGTVVSQIKRVVLAGGFGTFLNPRSAAAIGMIPQELCEKAEAVGNAAGEGAVSAAVSIKARKTVQQLVLGMHYVELASHPGFSDIYTQEMGLEI